MKVFFSKTAGLAIIVLMLVLSTQAHAKTWKMSLGDALGSTQHAYALSFAKALEAKTGGKYKLNFFPNGQLGSEQDTVNDCAMGTLDFSLIAVNNLTPFSPTVGLLSLPYVIQSLDEAYALSQGPVGQELMKNTIRDAGVRILGWTYTGFRNLTNSKRPVKTLEDLKGLVIRVPKNAIMIDTFKAWGINPTPMAWSETFTALQQKVVDGQDHTLMTINIMKFYETQTYLTSIRYIFLLEPLLMSEELFQKQSPEMQKILMECGREASKESKQYLIKSEAAIKKSLVEKGMIFTEPADGEKAWIEKATQKVWPKYYESIGGKDKLENALKSLGRSL